MLDYKNGKEFVARHVVFMFLTLLERAHEAKNLTAQNQQAPEYLNSMFIKVSEFGSRQLRDSDTDLYVPLLKTACGQKSFSYRGAKLWNSQQTEAKKANLLPNS